MKDKHWSEKPPTAPGLYWHLRRGAREVRIVEIADHYGKLVAFNVGWDIPQEITPGLWMKARKPSPPAMPRDYRR